MLPLCIDSTPWPGLPNFQEPHPSPMFYTPLGDPDHGSVNITVK